jgi:hypothetical protein
MKVTKALAQKTPVCACREYIEEGDDLEVNRGVCGMENVWWVRCPNCGNSMGDAMHYPIGETLRKLKEVKQ